MKTNTDTMRARMLARVLAPVALAAGLLVPMSDAQAAGPRVCDDAGRCATLSQPRGELAAEARRWTPKRAGWEYAGKAHTRLGEGEGVHVAKSLTRSGTWHVWTLARRTPAARGPRMIACPGGELTVTRNLRRGSCVYPGAAPSRSEVGADWPGYRVRVLKMRCGRGAWLAADHARVGGWWAYCERGKPTKAAKRWAKRHPYQVHREPRRVTPAPAPAPSDCETAAATFPVHQRIGLSYVYPESVPVCEGGRLVITVPAMWEDGFGWNCYRDGNVTCGENLARYDAGCVTDRRDGYTMCRDGRVYLRSSNGGQSHLIWRIPR